MARTALAGLAFLVVLGCERRSEPVTMATVWSEDAPDHETWSAELVLSSGGIPRILMTAAYMASYERTDTAYVVLSALDDTTSARVRSVVFDAEGDTSAVVLADRVYWFEDENRLVARGNVRVRAASGRRLQSEHLEWLDDERLVRTPGFARVYMESGVLEGYGLTADEVLGDVLMANITGQVEVRDE